MLPAEVSVDQRQQPPKHFSSAANFKEGEAEERGLKEEDKNKHAAYPGCCKAFIAFAWEDLHNSTRPELKAIKSLKESVPSYVLSILEFHKQCKHGILPGSGPRGRLLHTQIRTRTLLVLFPISSSCALFTTWISWTRIFS